MAYAHVAHDCVVGDNCILANGATLAGHIEVGDFAIIGGLSAIHQFTKIGSHVILMGGSLVDKDVPPFVKGAKFPLSYCGINSVGLSRRGFSQETINLIKEYAQQHSNNAEIYLVGGICRDLYLDKEN